MEEIRVGEYVRTKSGYIHHITKILNFKNEWYSVKDDKHPEFAYQLQSKDIVKHSPNIIDLIEERRHCVIRI